MSHQDAIPSDPLTQMEQCFKDWSQMGWTSDEMKEMAATTRRSVDSEHVGVMMDRVMEDQIQAYLHDERVDG